MSIGKQALAVHGFDPARVEWPWQEFSTWSSWEEAISWVLQAMKVTAAGMDAGADDVTWPEFEERLTDTFGSDRWRVHPIVRRLIKTAQQRGADAPLRIDDDLWVQIGEETQHYVDTWFTDATDLWQLSYDVGIDPVAHGWVTGDAQPEQSAQPEPQEGQRFELDRDFERLMRWHVDQTATLPALATVGEWFGRSLRAETVVSRCRTTFPDGITGAAATVTLDQIGAFYLGADVWARTSSWYTGDAEPTAAHAVGTGRKRGPDLAKDFAGYVKQYVLTKDLPDLDTVRRRFGPKLWPEAVVAQFQTDFPHGVTTSQREYTPDEIGAFYLGERVMARTKALQADIERYLQNEEDLTPAQLKVVEQAIESGVLVLEDDD